VNKRDFICISIAGAAGVLFVPRKLMADVAPALDTKLAGGVYHTATAFGRWNQGIADAHLAEFKKTGSKLHVVSHHPMKSYEHYIVKHELLDSKFNFITEHSYDPKAVKTPEATFEIDGRSGVIYVLTMCNVHDVWVNATEV
jgi:superoxide reductase